MIRQLGYPILSVAIFDDGTGDVSFRQPRSDLAGAVKIALAGLEAERLAGLDLPDSETRCREDLDEAARLAACLTPAVTGTNVLDATREWVRVQLADRWAQVTQIADALEREHVLLGDRLPVGLGRLQL